MLVSIAGVIQKPNTGTGQPSEGFALDGANIVFSSPPPSGADYFIITIGATVGIGTPSAGTVTEAILNVSNSPVNGYFLQAQSGAAGGLTWAAVDLTNLSATNLTSGTIPNARFPAALPAIDGSALTGITAQVADGCVLENNQTISNNYTMGTNKSGISAGPITINNGITVNIPSGSRYVIV